jgi:hypothetical protein
MVNSCLSVYESLAWSTTDSIHRLLPTLWSMCTRGSTASSSPFLAFVVVLPPVVRPHVHVKQLLGLVARASTARGTLAIVMGSKGGG